MKMRKSLEVRVKPEILKTLRETSGYTMEEIAKKLKTTVKRIDEIEKDIASFTLTQIKRLADVYCRPLAAFFTDALPDMPVLADHRINREKRLTPQVYISERRAYYLANKLAELTGKKSQIPTFPETLRANELASEFRKHLNTELSKLQKPEKLLETYKQILEERLLISIIELPLKAKDVRGFSLVSDISIIVLNEEDKPQIRLFSLFHEIYHLLKKTSGICSIEIGQEEDGDVIESECDRFSADFLVPLDDLKEECDKFSRLDEDAISELSKTYGVSKQVIMLRLLRLKGITKERYNQFKSEGVEKLKKKNFGRRNWDNVFKNRVGNLAIMETENAYRSGKISYSEVMAILNIKAKYTEKFVGR